jgi:hypothetical protein
MNIYGKNVNYSIEVMIESTLCAWLTRSDTDVSVQNLCNVYLYASLIVFFYTQNLHNYSMNKNDTYFLEYS